MRVAFVAFDGMTVLDLIGAYEPITRLDLMGFAALEWDVCARTETASETAGLTVVADRVDPDLGEYDLIVVPGGRGTRELREDRDYVAWLRGAEDCEWKVSVCTGSLLLGAAGFLEGRRATTHPSAYDVLAEYCEVVEERVVEDGDTITGRGVSSSIDTGLYVAERLAGREARDEIAEGMDYPYGPEMLV